MAMHVVSWYRATSFGKPIGPWRDSLRNVFEDLRAEGLGCPDEWGTFYVTVPGGYQTRRAWEEIEEADRVTWETRARLHARRS